MIWVIIRNRRGYSLSPRFAGGIGPETGTPTQVQRVIKEALRRVIYCVPLKEILR